jgi:hypothetical protein
MVQPATTRPVLESDKGAANGVASLDSTAVIPLVQVPTISRAKLALDVRTSVARGDALLDSDGKIIEAALSAALIAKIGQGGSSPAPGTSRVYLTQTQYDALTTKDPAVEYNIVTNPPATSTPTQTVYLTQTQYDALSTKDANTEYNITGA